LKPLECHARSIVDKQRLDCEHAPVRSQGLSFRRVRADIPAKHVSTAAAARDEQRLRVDFDIGRSLNRSGMGRKSWTDRGSIRGIGNMNRTRECSRNYHSAAVDVAGSEGTNVTD
jgi:hypothetical protein